MFSRKILTIILLSLLAPGLVSGLIQSNEAGATPLPLSSTIISTSALTPNGQPPEPPGGQDDPLPKIEPILLEKQGAAAQNMEFFIWMKEKADLSPAGRLKTKEEKGRFVFEALQETAGRSQRGLRAGLAQRGVKYRAYYIANKIFVRGGNRNLLLNVAARSDVARITANHTYQLPKPIINPKLRPHITALESNVAFIKANEAWALGVDGAGTVLAGNDTGLDWDHPALIDRYRGWNGTTVDHNYNWWDATGTYPDAPDDGDSHGTHTTGTMVGDDGGVNQIGVAPGARTIHCKNMTDLGSGNDQTFTDCFEWDLAPWDLNGANPRPDLAPDAVNNSWGYSGGAYPAFEDEVAALQAAGIVVEVSAGNDGPSCQTLSSPGDYDQVLTTGSVSHAGGALPGVLTNFSSRGQSDLYPGAFVPDVVAPGENIRSSVPGGGYQGGWSGTSMAGPHVAGLVGLMWSANSTLRGQVETTVQIIRETAVPLTGQTGSNCGGDYDAGPNNDWGYGAIDALAAVQQALRYGDVGTLAGVVTDNAAALPLSEATIKATFSPTLTWETTTDPQGAFSLRVISGSHTVDALAYGYYPETITNVIVVSATTTTLAFSLTPAPDYVVSGRVTDANTGWPIPVQIVIEGYPGDPIQTDPTTGLYSVTLAAGVPYVFNVAGDVPGYETASRLVGPLTGARTEDFGLLVDAVACIAPDYTPDTIYREEFEDDDGGYTHSGSQDEWEWGVPTDWPHTCSSGANCWGVDLDNDYNGISNQILTSPSINLSTIPPGTPLAARWRQAWQIEAGYDEAYAEVRIDDGPWQEMWRFDDSSVQFNWTAIIYDLSSAAESNVQFRWRLISDNIIAYPGLYVDDVAITGACHPTAGGFVAGRVYDANTGLPLAGATITSDSSQEAVTGADGFYQLSDAPGGHTLTATLEGGYEPDVQFVDVPANDTIWQDFNLPAGQLVQTPFGLEATLKLGESMTQSVRLTNNGGDAATFEVYEKPGVVPWLSEDPLAGTMAPATKQDITITFDAGVPEITQPGQYYAELWVGDDTPYNLPNVPVTMTVIIDPCYQDQIPLSECQALLALYDSTDGPNWTDNSGWLVANTPCSWYGVVCKEGHVTELRLKLNNLSGSMPAELSDLTGLEILLLAGNNLSGTIPVELGDLTNLIQIRLSENNLNGGIPAELENLVNLERLSLENNRLSGPIPPELGNLVNLDRIRLQNNQLGDDIPSEITLLVNLDETFTNFGYNMLTAADPAVIDFLDQKEPDWADTQTIPPADLHAEAQSDSSVVLAWTPIPYTAHGGYYEIMAATTPDGPYTSHGITADKTAAGYLATDLSPGTTYSFQVCAFTPAHDKQQNNLRRCGEAVTATTSGVCQTTLRIDPPDQAVYLPAGPFTVTAVISDVTDLGGFVFDLHYDPAVVQVDDAAIGPFPASTGRSVSPVEPVIDNQTGQLSFSAFSFGPAPGPSGTGVVAVVSLSPQVAGTGVLDLSGAQVADADDRAIPICTLGGQVTINDCFDFDCDWEEMRIYLPFILNTQ